MTPLGTHTRRRTRHVLSEVDLAVLEARNEMGDISGADVVRLIDAVRYLQQSDRRVNGRRSGTRNAGRRGGDCSRCAQDAQQRVERSRPGEEVALTT